MSKPYVVYLLACADGTLYCGCTCDLARRLRAHNAGKGAKYTRSRLPVRAVYTEACPDKSSALKREAHVKKLSRSAKWQLVQSQSKEGVSDS